MSVSATSTTPQSAAGVAPAARSPIVRVRDLTKTFVRSDGSPVQAVQGVSLDVHPGEFLVLLGPSGCGKTTLLRAIAGLEEPDAGSIEIADRQVFGAGQPVPPEAREIGMIFQSYALWPHLTVGENVAFPLRSRRVPRRTIPARVDEALKMVGIGDLADQYPGQISGGQQQRVALARALIARNGVILFDEPLSNVDAKVREQLRHELVEMQRELKFAAIYVTHDQHEALALATRIAVLGEGAVQQVADPQVVYERPANRYVADFVGTINVIPVHGPISRSNDRWSAATSLGSLSFAASVDTSLGQPPHGGDIDLVLVCRPEAVEITAATSDTGAVPHDVNELSGTLTSRTFSGPHSELQIATGEAILRSWAPSSSPAAAIPVGADVEVRINPDDLRLVSA